MLQASGPKAKLCLAACPKAPVTLKPQYTLLKVKGLRLRQLSQLLHAYMVISTRLNDTVAEPDGLFALKDF